MILELNLNEATMLVYNPEPEYESFETSEIVIPINRRMKLVISGCRRENNDYVYEVPPMAKFIDLADEDEDEELEETIKISCDNLVLCETNFIVKNNIKNLLNNYI